MKALFVGLGSIGSRHLRNLSALCKAKDIPLQAVALRSSDRPLPPETEALLHQQYTSLPEEESFDLAFITNPTHLHAIALGGLKGRVHAFFIEKPVFDHADYDLEVLGLGPQQKAYVAAPMRWTGLYLALKQQLAQCAPFSARAICSSYLPDWRAGVDYRTIYSAHREQGGGVTLDLIHEWDYLVDLFGFPAQSHNLRGQLSNLEIDSDDLSVYIARWEGLVGEVHLDYFGRQYRRTLELLCDCGTVMADFGTGQLTLQDGSTESYAEDTNRRFEREMEYFLTYALGGHGESINSPQHALQVLQVALEESYGG